MELKNWILLCMFGAFVLGASAGLLLGATLIGRFDAIYLPAIVVWCVAVCALALGVNKGFKVISS